MQPSSLACRSLRFTAPGMPSAPHPTRVPLPAALVPTVVPTPHTAGTAKDELEQRSTAMVTSISVLVAFVVVFCAWLKFCTRPRKPKAVRKSAALNVTALYIYPVKSCAALPQQTLTIDRLGFKWDRRFVVISSATNAHVSQREYPRMALIQPRILESTGKLLLSFPGEPEMIEVELEPHRAAGGAAAAGVERANVTVWDDTMQAYLYEDPSISVWLARVLQLPEGRAALKLAATLGPEDHRRPIQPPFDRTVTAAVAAAAAASQAASSSASSSSSTAVASIPPIAPGFHDQFPILLASESSLRAVNSWTEPKGRKVEMLAFRPNIVVAGPNLKPFAEDFWRRISIGPEAPVDPTSPAGVALAAAAALRDAQALSRLKRKAATAAAQAADRALSSQPSTLPPIQPGQGVDFHVVKAAPRCILTTVIPSEGRFHPSGEPLLALREHRRILEHIPSQKGGAFFAQHCTPAASEGGSGGLLIGATIRVGDAVRVRERKMHAFDPVAGMEAEVDREAVAEQNQERDVAMAALVAREAERTAAEAAAAAAENAEEDVEAAAAQHAAAAAAAGGVGVAAPALDADEKQTMSNSKKDQ